ARASARGKARRARLRGNPLCCTRAEVRAASPRFHAHANAAPAIRLRSRSHPARIPASARGAQIPWRAQLSLNARRKSVCLRGPGVRGQVPATWDSAIPRRDEGNAAGADSRLEAERVALRQLREAPGV